MLKKIVNIIFIVVVLLFITLPLALSDKDGGKASNLDNRMLAKMPSMNLSFSDFSKQLEEWISDNAKGRNTSLNINSMTDSYVFGLYPKDLIRGKQNYSFLINDDRIACMQHTDVPDDNEIARISDQLTDMTVRFKEQDISFFSLVIPSKHDVYKEFLPDTIIPIRPASAIEVLDRKLSNNPNFDFYVPINVLLDAKEERHIYYKAGDGNHWNYFGAFVGYQSIMSHVQKYIGDIRILDKTDFNLIDRSYDVRFGGKFIAREEKIDFELKEPHTSRDDSFFDNIYFKSKDPWRSYAYYKNQNQDLPKLVVVGDSFIWMFMNEMLSESFSEYVFIHWLDAGNLDTIVAELNPDIIVFSSIELAGGLNAYEGGIKDATSLPVDANKLSAQMLSSTTPGEVTRGQAYSIDITVKNTGKEIWSESNQVQLCIFVNGEDWGFRNSIHDGVAVMPGEEYTFTIEQYEPPEEGQSAYMEYQMVHGDKGYFGEKKRVDIIIH